ncbi:MAG: quinolinate synthase NadA [Bacteroidaceae bacterium]|nr:quinolinate synthase NadA [Bacteroidaceae bacterium]
MKQEWTEQGYIDEPAKEGTDLREEIRRMAKEKNAVIMAHYYTTGDIQDIADFIGDSLALAQQAEKTEADIIVMCGVHFMAETCKILCPEKTVLCPDLTAGCSLADSCSADDLKAFKAEHTDHMVVSYVNTTAAVKALTDVCVTSGNARKIIEKLPADAKIIFGPDKNLGAYINSVTGREMLLWNGGCHVHERFSVAEIAKLKQEHPDAKVLAHPECKGAVLQCADIIGSTAVLLKYCQQHKEEKEFIVATESGILHEMQKSCPDVNFIPVPPKISEGGKGCSCNECEYMKKNSLLKIYNALKYGWPTVEVPEETAKEAVKCINRMLEMS